MTVVGGLGLVAPWGIPMHSARVASLVVVSGLLACQLDPTGFGSSSGAEPDASLGSSSTVAEPPTSTSEVTTAGVDTTSADPTTDPSASTSRGADDTGTGTGEPPDVVCENLLVNPSVETGSLAGWTVMQAGGAQVAQGSAHDGDWALRTAHDPFMREQEVDLVAAGLDPAFLDTSPDIVVEEWLQEVWARDHYWIRVELRDEGHATLDSWVVDDWTTGRGESYDDDTYFAVGHTFRGYPAGVRYVLFRDGGQDGEYWAGHYGVVIDASRVEICHPR